MSLGATGEIPLYQVVAQALRKKIRAGQLAQGSRVPTEHELMKDYEVSRNTVRLALNVLTSEGLIMAGRGRAGRVVRRRELVTIHVAQVESNSQHHGQEDAPFEDEMHRQGFEPSTEIEIGMVPAPDLISDRLNLPPDTTVVVRRRTRHLDGVACSIADSYYPYDIVKDTAIMQPHAVKPGVTALLAEQGWVQDRYMDEVSTRMPEPDEARRLGLGSGVPVLFQIRTGYVGARPIRLTRTVLRGDRHRIVYELPA
ncbi:MAG: GntR family transcriptional regulator [Micromonosporaceae bacterium]